MIRRNIKGVGNLTAEQIGSEDYFRFADKPSRIIARRSVIQAFPRCGKVIVPVGGSEIGRGMTTRLAKL